MATSVDEATKKYRDNISQERFEKGVNAVNKNPAEAALRKKDEFVANTLAQEKLLVKNLSKVNIDEWKKRTKESFQKLREKAIAAANSGKYPAAEVLAAGVKAHNVVEDMPNRNYADSYNRLMAARKAIQGHWKR